MQDVSCEDGFRSCAHLLSSMPRLHNWGSPARTIYSTCSVTAFYIRGCQEKKVLPRLEGAKKFLLTSSPCIEVRIRDCSVSPDSSRWRDDVVRLMTQQAVRLSGGNHGSI